VNESANSSVDKELIKLIELLTANLSIFKELNISFSSNLEQIVIGFVEKFSRMLKNIQVKFKTNIKAQLYWMISISYKDNKRQKSSLGQFEHLFVRFPQNDHLNQHASDTLDHLQVLHSSFTDRFKHVGLSP
jgi:hypothetical protein